MDWALVNSGPRWHPTCLERARVNAMQCKHLPNPAWIANNLSLVHHSLTDMTRPRQRTPQSPVWPAYTGESPYQGWSPDCPLATGGTLSGWSTSKTTWLGWAPSTGSRYDRGTGKASNKSPWIDMVVALVWLEHATPSRNGVGTVAGGLRKPHP